MVESKTVDSAIVVERTPSVLFLMNSLIIAGSEKKVAKLAAYLSTRGWAVEAAYLNAPHDLAKEFPGSVTITCLERKNRFDISVFFRLNRHLKKRRPEVVVCVNLFPLLYLYISGCLRARRIFSTIVLINKTDFLRGLSGRIRAAAYASILKKPDRLVFGARFQRKVWLDRYRLSSGKSTVIYNGVDTDRFCPKLFCKDRAVVRQTLGLNDQNFTLITVAGLRPVKNLPLLLKALQRLHIEFPDIRAILVGDGPERSNLESLADSLSIRHIVHFSGNTKDVRPFLSAGDLFVLTSESETFSNAALEAMSMERAVVLPNNGGSAEMVEHEVNGWIFEPGDTDSLVNQVRCAARSPATTLEMGAAAREKVLREFPVENMLERYEILFQTEIEPKSHRRSSALRQ